MLRQTEKRYWGNRVKWGNRELRIPVQVHTFGCVTHTHTHTPAKYILTVGTKFDMVGL